MSTTIEDTPDTNELTVTEQGRAEQQDTAKMRILRCGDCHKQLAVYAEGTLPPPVKHDCWQMRMANGRRR